MEKKYAPRVSIRKAEKGGVFLEYARDYRYGQKHPMPGHSITAEQEDLIDLFNRIPDGSTEYLSKEEHDAIVQNLVEALEFTIYATEYLYNIKKDLPKGLDPTFYHTLSYEGDMELREKAIKARAALENYKKQTGEGK